MTIVNIDSNQPDLLKPFEFKLLPKGTYLFEVANDLIVEQCASSQNQIIKVENVCLDEGEWKGTKVFENFIIMVEPTTEKQLKGKAINEAKLAQFAVATGVANANDLDALSSLDLDSFKGTTFKAMVGVASYQNQQTNETKQKNVITRYLFDVE